MLNSGVAFFNFTCSTVWYGGGTSYGGSRVFASCPQATFQLYLFYGMVWWWGSYGGSRMWTSCPPSQFSNLPVLWYGMVGELHMGVPWCLLPAPKPLFSFTCSMVWYGDGVHMGVPGSGLPVPQASFQIYLFYGMVLWWGFPGVDFLFPSQFSVLPVLWYGMVRGLHMGFPGVDFLPPKPVFNFTCGMVWWGSFTWGSWMCCSCPNKQFSALPVLWYGMARGLHMGVPRCWVPAPKQVFIFICCMVWWVASHGGSMMWSSCTEASFYITFTNYYCRGKSTSPCLCPLYFGLSNWHSVKVNNSSFNPLFTISYLSGC